MPTVGYWDRLEELHPGIMNLTAGTVKGRESSGKGDLERQPLTASETLTAAPVLAEPKTSRGESPSNAQGEARESTTNEPDGDRDSRGGGQEFFGERDFSVRKP